MQTVERWDVFEITTEGKDQGNPFLDYEIKGTFDSENEHVIVDGFYDGNRTYKVRFMPSYEGIYRYRISGTFSDEVTEGCFEAVSAVNEKNHGPVCVVDDLHLGYADGTPYYSIGTTCYAWVNQDTELQEKTLITLEGSVFNKIRFCIFPKYYDYNKKDPLTYPFERGNGEGLNNKLVEKEARERILFPGMQPPVLDTKFNYYRPNIKHFQRYDLRIRQLKDLGIEADIILMHPYDRWGNNMMNQECCDAYLRYVVARFGAYRNVWWSLANEYDLIITKTEADWERYAAVICDKDPYHHLKSIHNCFGFYDYTKPWITHCSAQRIDFYRHVEYTDEYLVKYKKPVVWDEIGYEGNLPLGWGNLTPQELVRRFWEAFLRGGHAGHGETYLDSNDIIWWSHGGILKGESPIRLKFLLEILKAIPGGYLKKGYGLFDEVVGIPQKEEKEDKGFGTPFCGYEIHYFGINQPAFRMLYFMDEDAYDIDVIDTWNMTVTNIGIHSGAVKVPLPQRPYMAIRIKKVEV